MLLFIALSTISILSSSKMAFAANYIPFLVLLFLTNNLLPSSALSDKPFPCFFIFGDSLVDSGNNNDLNTSAKVDYSPYGVDFPYGATGRFTNGLTSADFLGDAFLLVLVVIVAFVYSNILSLPSAT